MTISSERSTLKVR